MKSLNYFKKFDNLDIKIKYSKKKFILIMSLLIIFLIAVTVSVSYAYLTKISFTNNSYKISAGNLSLELANEENIFNLEKVVPQEDNDALKNNSAHTFMLKNTGGTATSYVIKLENTCNAGNSYNGRIAEKCITNSYIKAGIKSTNSNYKIVSNNEEDEIILDSGILETNEVKNYNLKLWLSWDTPNEFNTRNVFYSGKLFIEYTQGKQNIDDNKYNILFDANGGEGVMEGQNVMNNSSVTLNNNTFVKDGYNFIGWNIDKFANDVMYEDEDIYSNTSETDNGNIVLYAVWSPINYEVSYNSSGGVGTMENTSHTYGEAFALPQCLFTKEGFSFAGWSTNPDDTNPIYLNNEKVINLTTAQNDIVNLYAVWEPPSYIVNVNVLNGSVTGKSEKKVYSLNNTSFKINGISQDYIASVSCSNDQIGEITGDTLTVSNVTSDTTCTVKYSLIQTVLYNDGTLIINENEADRDNNTSTHGSIISTYQAYGPLNSYSADNNNPILWNDNIEQIKTVEFGSVIKPLSTAWWFSGAKYLSSFSSNNLDLSNCTSMMRMLWNAGSDATSVNYDFTNLNTSNVTSMTGLFGGVGTNSSSVTITGLSTWDTSKVTEMDFMFYNVGKGTSSVNVTGFQNWNTSSLTSMMLIFCYLYNKVNTINLDLRNWDVSHVTSMDSAFSNLGANSPSITINVSGWDVSKVSSFSSLFSWIGFGTDCTVSLIGLNTWNTDSLTSAYFVFQYFGYRASSINLDISSWDLSKVATYSYMMDNLGQKATSWIVKIPRRTGTYSNNATTLYIGEGNVLNPPEGRTFTIEANISVNVLNGTVNTPSKTVNMGTNATFNITASVSDYTASVSCTNGQTGNVSNNVLTISNVSNDTVCTVNIRFNATTLYNDGTLIINESSDDRASNTSIHGAVVKSYAPLNASNSYIFTDSSPALWNSDLNSIKRVDFGSVVSPLSTAYWFKDAKKLETGNFTNLDTSNVTDMRNMFYYAGADVTGNVTYDLTSFNVSNVEEVGLSGMFQYAGSSANNFTLLLSGWNTSKVTNISVIFTNAGVNATNVYLDVTNWQTQNATTASVTFGFFGQNARSVNFVGLNTWDVSKLTDIGYMFAFAAASVDTFNVNLSNWNLLRASSVDTFVSYFGWQSSNWTLRIPRTTSYYSNNSSTWYTGTGASMTPPAGKSFTLG